MHVVGPRAAAPYPDIYQIYASYLHVRILYEFLGTFQSLKVFGKFKNKSKCFWKPSSKFTIRNGYLVTVYKSGFVACLWSTSCASALVLALEIRHWGPACAACAVDQFLFLFFKRGSVQPAQAWPPCRISSASTSALAQEVDQRHASKPDL